MKVTVWFRCEKYRGFPGEKCPSFKHVFLDGGLHGQTLAKERPSLPWIFDGQKARSWDPNIDWIIKKGTYPSKKMDFIIQGFWFFNHKLDFNLCTRPELCFTMKSFCFLWVLTPSLGKNPWCFNRNSSVKMVMRILVDMFPGGGGKKNAIQNVGPCSYNLVFMNFLKLELCSPTLS